MSKDNQPPATDDTAGIEKCKAFTGTGKCDCFEPTASQRPRKENAQEWTPEYLSLLFDAECSPEEAIKRICALHKAALDKHDTEARKQLVDALEQIIDVASGYTVGSKLSIISRLATDALAKVKP
jgi:hypothetical protein